MIIRNSKVYKNDQYFCFFYEQDNNDLWVKLLYLLFENLFIIDNFYNLYQAIKFISKNYH
jgi:hypothetical protein